VGIYADSEVFVLFTNARGLDEGGEEQKERRQEKPRKGEGKERKKNMK